MVSVNIEVDEFKNFSHFRWVILMPFYKICRIKVFNPVKT